MYHVALLASSLPLRPIIGHQRLPPFSPCGLG